MPFSSALPALALLFCSALSNAPLQAAQGTEATLAYSAFDNGDFSEAGPRFKDESGLQRIPWWRSAQGMQQVVEVAGRAALRCKAGEWASQPIPVYEPLLTGLRVRGELRGAGVLEIVDGKGAVARFEMEYGEFSRFEITGEQLIAKLGVRPMPRLDLRLSSQGAGVAHWRALEATVELPLPTEEALRAELVELMRSLFNLWFERGLDEEGTVHTGMLCSVHDVITGERVMKLRAGYHPLFGQLMGALLVQEDAQWRAVMERYLESYFTHCLHPETGLPQGWDAFKDVPVANRGIEIALAFSFLIDLAEKAEAPWKERALQAAIRIGDIVLANGVRPDGSIDTRYRADTGKSNAQTPPIRRLGVPAELARLGRLTGDERYTQAALRAVRRLEYTHYWAGDWNHLDPGFDDHFGHYGGHGAILWKSHPAEPSFKAVTLSGFAYYVPIWKDAVRLGGYIAADEVRCWDILRHAAALDEDLRAGAHDLLWPAIRSHFKSEQYHNGTWGDVTYYLWDPKVNLMVGDLPAIPQNIMHGLALSYQENLGLRTDEVRAMFTTILRATDAAYRRPYGYLGSLTQNVGQNTGGGSIRLLTGLVEMLRQLSE